MVKFLKTYDIASELTKIIDDSKEKLVLISPYFNIPKTFADRIMNKSNSITIDVVYRELSPDGEAFLQKLKNVNVYSCDYLHAKCYFNEKNAIIASLNLYEESLKNYEMGILIENSDADLFKFFLEEANQIIKASNIQFSLKSGKSSSEKSGFCINCKSQIELKLKKPLCIKCYDVWRKTMDPEFRGKFCHICGNEFFGTFNKPAHTKCSKLKK